jgi:hypothetical protein
LTLEKRLHDLCTLKFLKSLFFTFRVIGNIFKSMEIHGKGWRREGKKRVRV